MIEEIMNANARSQIVQSRVLDLFVKNMETPLPFAKTWNEFAHYMQTQGAAIILMTDDIFLGYVIDC